MRKSINHSGIVFAFAYVCMVVPAFQLVAQQDNSAARNSAARNSTSGRVGQSKSRFSDEQYTNHIRQLKKTLPHSGFSVILQKPFVVIGDESKEMVEYRSEKTVKWAVERIKKDYFSEEPNAIIDVWLFKDKSSYEKHTEELFGKKPHTPYGYYSSSDRALVMNIATGGGTLVHEIVHPFIEANFEDCPAWFNEGLASLYEQCQDNNGRIWGKTNWRLRGLQLALESDRVPTFEELFSTTTREFYNEDPGTNYSQARYLCYYLQQKGLLVKFYHRFVKDVDDDPTGYETLKHILKRTDIARFEAEWKTFVLDLRFGR